MHLHILDEDENPLEDVLAIYGGGSKQSAVGDIYVPGYQGRVISVAERTGKTPEYLYLVCFLFNIFILLSKYKNIYIYLCGRYMFGAQKVYTVFRGFLIVCK